MKKSDLLNIIREEIQSVIKEFNAGLNIPLGDPTMDQSAGATSPRNQHFYNKAKWRVIAMQLGAVVVDRGDDLKATRPDGTILGVFDKMTNIGTLTV